MAAVAEIAAADPVVDRAAAGPVVAGLAAAAPVVALVVVALVVVAVAALAAAALAAVPRVADLAARAVDPAVVQAVGVAADLLHSAVVQ